MLLFIAAITLFSMAKGLRIGVRVKAKATKILGARGATQEFGKQASKVEMLGEIVRKEGAGLATKWVVRWDKPLNESAWNARSLTREDDNEAADEGPDNSTTSNDVLSFLKNLIFGGQQLRSPWGTNTCADKD